jgi:hypothetical protein
MGYTYIADINDQVDIDTALRIHLTYNCHPPVPVVWIDSCKNAVEAYNRGDYDAYIDLPEGFTYNRWDTTYAPARVLVAQLYLDAFVDEP